MSLKKIAEILDNANRIGITYHVSPDGDAIGSVLGLLCGLRSLKKDAYILSKEELSENLKYLPFANEINGRSYVPNFNTDTVIVLDCGNYERICAELKTFTGTLLNVDHHVSNDRFGDENYVDTKAAATAEIVYELLEHLGIDFTEKNEEVLKIATCLYTSIVTDTGGFRYSNVTEKTHKIAGALKSLGVNNTMIYENLFDNKEFSRIKLIGKAISNIELFSGGKIALIKLPLALSEEVGIDIGDTSDIIHYGLGIKNVEVTLLLKEVENGIKVSLRSRDDVNVSKVAEKFGGGGHVKAAGIYLKGKSLKETQDMILNEIRKEL